MNDCDDLFENIAELAKGVAHQYDIALRQHTPEINRIIRTNDRSATRIEQELEALLDFGDDPQIRQLYRRLCRHYWTIDHAATAEYVYPYRDLWDEVASPEAEPKGSEECNFARPPNIAIAPYSLAISQMANVET